MLLLACLFVGIGLVTAQTQKVTGVVISEEDGQPVVGASVLVKGTTLGTITDVDGNFNLSNVPSSAKTLQISYIGMQTQEVAIKPKLKIVLKSDTEVLDEVIVTAYGTSTKGTFTGSASVMKADKIEKRQVSNVSNALAGAVAGVQILSDNGQPGESAKVRIRGVGSINAGMEPLYVVDGVPYDGELSSINSADIETMTVLKDAASTALYGARGANGIIMITTKKGTSGKARINFDAKWGVNSRAIKTYDVMTSPKNYIETAYQSIYNSQISLGYSPEDANIRANKILPSGASGGLGYQVYTTAPGELLVGSNGKLNPNATLGYSDGQYYYTPDNWADETFQNNLRQEYNLSAAGGSDKGTYYFAFGYLDDQGVISGSGFKRLNGRFKGDYKLYSWLKIGANVSYVNTESRYPGDQDANATASSGNAFYIANNMAPIYPLYVRGADKQIMLNNGRKVYDYGDGQSTNFSRSFMSIANPSGDLIYNKREYLSDVINANWFAEITPITGLTISARYGLNIDNTRQNEMGNAYMGQSASYGGTAYQAAIRTYGFDQQYVANYQFALKDVHHFDVTAGYDGYSYEYTLLEGSGQNLYNPESFYLGNVIDKFTIGGKKDLYSTKGFFGRVNYSYNDTYFGNVSYRRDASSRFAPENRWGNFWSASVAWMLTRESFMEDITWVNMLKLKASFGQQGNDDILYPGVLLEKNYYPWLDQYKMTGANGTFADGTLLYKGNPDITWETSTSYNIGADFGLFNNKLNGSIEYFGRKSKDMLYNRPTAGSLGYTAVPMNVGSMTNSGVEIDLNYQIMANKKFNWSVNLNATFVKNKINKLHPDLNGKLIDSDRIYEEGESMYRMYLVDYAGVDEKTGEALYWAKDDNGNAIKTPEYSTAENYKVATDDMMPTVYGGLGTTFEAYGFDASIQLSYQLGGKIYDTGYRRLMHGGASSSAGWNWHKDIYNAWTPENPTSNIPRLNANDKYTNSASTRWLTSSDYLSINNITVGYTLPQQLVKKVMLDKVRVYFTADNVALISARKGLDPRQSYISATTALYTPIRTISGGISLTF
ncbi:TonB-dependent receptor [Bacteroides xylanisolvens]|nr:TonB-dependent receptor [Bacteroides xylanisolvens]MCE8924412.1 TonB-dependent receptor [Bacteroides ovatus]MBV3906245.1 TonB-dependent receptor [Bacteroides xylanisolvens]MBV3910400.1 TonB-dependent receptor [Bacteroides xylanisolvens]MBV3945065.1 TonB-dependent receptor [Bacteroides xylanisolvens]